MQNAVKAYNDVKYNVNGGDFERLWFESVIMVLNRLIDGNHYNEVEAHVKLLEVREGLQVVQENLNERMNSQHRTLLKNIYSTSIQIINGAIESKNNDYLRVVISVLQTVTEPYYKNKQSQ
jgi:hypothetical protein